MSYVRRRHPDGADRTATLPFLAGHLPVAPHRCRQRVAALGLASVDPLEQGDVADPAGGDEQDYVDCARELAALIGELVPRLVVERDATLQVRAGSSPELGVAHG